MLRNIYLFCITLLITTLTNAQTPDCNALKEKVQKRLQGKGITSYSLEWVDASSSVKGRVVGRCSKEKIKLVYSPRSSSSANSNASSTVDNPSTLETVAKKPEPVAQVAEPKPVINTPVPTPTVEAKVEEKVAAKPSVALQELIQSLRSSNGNFAASMQELTDRNDATTPLITAYYAATYDASFRFNVILTLNQKLKSKKLNNADTDAVTQCLLDGLKDSSSLVRSESVWGLGLTRNKKFAPAVNALLNDSDASVRNEAAITAQLLR